MAPGSPWAICISGGPTQYLYFADAFPGRIYKLSLEGKVLGVLGSSGKQLKQFGWIHEMACPSENVLFVAEILNHDGRVVRAAIIANHQAAADCRDGRSLVERQRAVVNGRQTGIGVGLRAIEL